MKAIKAIIIHKTRYNKSVLTASWGKTETRHKSKSSHLQRQHFLYTLFGRSFCILHSQANVNLLPLWSYETQFSAIKTVTTYIYDAINKIEILGVRRRKSDPCYCSRRGVSMISVDLTYGCCLKATLKFYFIRIEILSEHGCYYFVCMCVLVK